MIVMLQKVGLKPYGAPQPGLTVTQFQLVIGNGPQEADVEGVASRPVSCLPCGQ